eukprot:10707670-Alexandrium_andersonii.AAC.1
MHPLSRVTAVTAQAPLVGMPRVCNDDRRQGVLLGPAAAHGGGFVNLVALVPVGNNRPIGAFRLV